MEAFEQDIARCIETLHRGGLILYPTDTVWSIGCDATNEDAVERILTLKKNREGKSLFVLLTDERDVLQWVAAPDPAVFDFVATQEQPTTVIFEHALGFPGNLVGADGTIGIRLVQDVFCRHLIKRFRKPLVATSANITGMPAPAGFFDISEVVKKGVDYIVQWRQEEMGPARPAQIIRWVKGNAQRIG